MSAFEWFKTERSLLRPFALGPSFRLSFFPPPGQHCEQISTIPIVFQCMPTCALSPSICAANRPLSASAHKFGRFDFTGPYGITDSIDTPCQGRSVAPARGGRGEREAITGHCAAIENRAERARSLYR